MPACTKSKKIGNKAQVINVLISRLIKASINITETQFVSVALCMCLCEMHGYSTKCNTE